MPLYEFTCTRCGETFEELVAAAGEGSGVACPACGSKDVEKLVSTFAASGGPSGEGGGGSCGSGGFT